MLRARGPHAAKSSALLLVDDLIGRVERNAVGLRSARRRRQASAANVRRSAGVRTHIPETARVGLRAAAHFETWDNTEEVADFLRELQMGHYVASFRANAVTGNTLLSLNSVELRNTLGVTKLRDRRVIMDAIVYLQETQEIKRALPEDGRILTHLSNEVTVLGWLRFGAILLLVSVANLRLVELSSGSNKSAVVALSFIVCCLGAAAMLYAFNRYYWMHQMIESPGLDFEPDNVRLITPGLLIPTFTVLLAYALMANDTEDAALLLLASA